MMLPNSKLAIQPRVANQGDSICKYNSIKVDTSINKSNRAKSRGWSKSGTNEKNIKEDRQQFVEPKKAR